MIKKDVKEIKNRINELSDNIIIKAKKYDDIIYDIDKVQIKVDKSFTCFDEKRLAYVVKINYSIEPTMLILDEDGEAMLDERFRAMNNLGLISLKDLNSIREQLDKAKKLNEEGGTQ